MCLFCWGGGLENLQGLKGNPLDRQQRHEKGFHLSDPCVFNFNNNMVLVYRENTKHNGIAENILYAKVMNSPKNWSDRKLIIHSTNDGLLSPALYVEKKGDSEALHMIHVKSYDSDSVLIHSTLDNNFRIQASNVINCDGIPKDYYIWHIAVAYADGMKAGAVKDKKIGLFLLKAKDEKSMNKLYLCETDNDGSWIVSREVATPSYLIGKISTPYKSCFIPNTNNIIYSYIDKKHRYRMTIISEVWQ